MRIVLSVLLVVAASCSSSGPDVQQTCTQLASAQCAKLDSCIKNGVTQRYGDLATCQTRLSRACVTSAGAASTGATTTSIAACTTAIPGADCSTFEDNELAACAPQIGALASGAACAYPAQCQSGFCAITKGTNCGVCATPTTAGASCATSSCVRGQVCNASTQLCEIPGTNGASCDAGHSCGFQLSCVTPAGQAEGSCQASGTTAGVACDLKRELAPACDASSALACDSKTKMCTEQTYATAGGACGFVGTSVVACTSASTCFGASGTIAGACKALALEGQACDTAAGPGCMAPARCVTGSATATAGTCQLPDPAACH